MRSFEEYLTEGSSGTYYHATHKDNLSSIRKNGITPQEKTSTTARDGSRLSSTSKIHVCREKKYAILWGAKLDYNLHKKFGSGKMYVITIKNGKNEEPDKHWESMGRWFKIDPTTKNDIKKIEKITSQMVQKASKSVDADYEEGTLNKTR